MLIYVYKELFTFIADLHILASYFVYALDRFSDYNYGKKFS